MKLQNKLKTDVEFWKIFIKETIKGKDLERILMNYVASSVTISGKTIDLGSGPKKASYYRFLKLKNATITFTDYYRCSKNTIKLDLEKTFEIKSDEYDTILCFNVIEHIFKYNNLIKESYRILRRDGIFIGSTPFLVRYHPDPEDYFRYTIKSIEKIFEEVGFKAKKFYYLGFGPLTAAYSMIQPLLPKILKLLLVPFIIYTDKLICKIYPCLKNKFPLGYFYIFTKK